MDSMKESIPVVVTDDVADVSGGSKSSRKQSIKPPGGGGRRKSIMKMSGTTALAGRRLTKALLDLPEEQNSIACKPKVRMENTYKMTPDEDSTFVPWKVRNAVKEILGEQLSSVSYDNKTASKLCCDLAQLIRNKVRNMEFPRYKIICNVIIGQCSEQGLEVASRCLWDAKTDNYSCIEYKNHSLFAIAMVHGDMGQILRRHLESQNEVENNQVVATTFPNLAELPPEISMAILSHLDATDLCLAACVWDNLANDDVLWMGLCKASWGYASVYKYIRQPVKLSYKKLFLLLDEASLTFNGNPFEGEEYLFKRGIMENNALEMAKFLHFTNKIKPDKKREYLDMRRDVLDHLLQLQNFQNQFLPNALRKLFGNISAPNNRGEYLTDIIDKFSDRFCLCNPKLGLDKDTVFVLCFSLIMLSVDLSSPAVKNKMSKREFIKNTRRAAQNVDDDLAGDLYDNVYLIGHVATETVS
ncbi:F-box only protein 8-like [Saccostrea echinata]|uniref:F-box only protein 8-like n=1 Tax=Saccostrea echinata TaxID=191078 RepID=UPI002A828877|nr:F-box only protein 8-like [Saccostrea echinata]